MFRLISVAVGIASASCCCLADSVPFWGVESPATNRPAPVGVACAVADFSSRDNHLAGFTLSPFRSDGLGLAVYIR